MWLQFILGVLFCVICLYVPAIPQLRAAGFADGKDRHFRVGRTVRREPVAAHALDGGRRARQGLADDGDLVRIHNEAADGFEIVGRRGGVQP